MELVTADLISTARAGDGEAFKKLTEPYRRELQVRCYRMLGSFQDAEDALQDTLLAAWQGLGKFEGRASIRTWLYRIATNRCLNALRSGRPRIPRPRGGRPAGLDPRIGQQRAETGPRQPAAQAAARGRPRTGCRRWLGHEDHELRLECQPGPGRNLVTAPAVSPGD